MIAEPRGWRWRLVCHAVVLPTILHLVVVVAAALPALVTLVTLFDAIFRKPRMQQSAREHRASAAQRRAPLDNRSMTRKRKG